MPSYELALMLRAMPKQELRTTLKRISHAVFDRGGILRNIENLGFRPMPYKSSAHGIVHREANYFIFRIDTATQTVADLKEEYKRDVDIVRQRVYKVGSDCEHSCTLEEELLPPAYREDVQKMIQIGKTHGSRFTYKFKYNSGLDYYPFQNSVQTPKFPSIRKFRVYQARMEALLTSYHLHIRRKSYFRHKYSVEVETAVNNQIQTEQQATQYYLQMAIAFLHPCQARPRAGSSFMRMFYEETGHVQHFLWYQLLRGGMPISSGLLAPNPKKYIRLLEAFNRTIKMEKSITEGK